jgi:MYXO-CTERM domain-containing protein
MFRRAQCFPLLSLALLAAACSNEIATDGAAREGSRTRRVSEAIVNGTPDTSADNAVVYIAINGNSGDFCTGSLITPNLVLTARHCVSALDETVECGAFTQQQSPSTLAISVGITPGTTIATATKILVDTPKGTSSCGNDIALFQLDKDVPGAMVAKVRFTPLTVGETARTAGYGDSGNGTPTQGRYEKTGIKVDSVGPASYTYTDKAGKTYPVTVPAGEIVTGESTCFGDSGGPLFDGMGNIIGLTSRGIDDKCIDRPSIYSDTASHAQFIKDAAVAAGHPLQDATPAPPGGSRPNDPGTSTQSNGTGGGTSTSGGGDDSGDSTTTTKPKKTSSRSLATENSGCSAAPGTTSSSSPFVALALAATAMVLVRRRNRKS